MNDVAAASVIRADLSRDPEWGQAIRRAGDLVRGEFAECQAGKVVEWRRSEAAPQTLDLTIRAGDHSGTAPIRFEELASDSTVQSRARIAWGRLNAAQEKWAYGVIRQTLADLIREPGAATAG